jgi:POT family proton-dependent oligopeptide transporter
MDYLNYNMTSIISNAYESHPEKKDGAYSLYYMGLMQELLGIMLCGYIGEKISWSWGFGLAGILCSSGCNFISLKIFWRYWFKTNIGF